MRKGFGITLDFQPEQNRKNGISGGNVTGAFQPRPAAARPAAPRPAAAPHRPSAQAQAANTAPSGDMAFEDKLKQFLSSSERKMADLNRNISGKQGGRRRR